jgi:hypothetical protein
MDSLKSVTASVKSCSSDCSMVLVYFLIFLSLPIDKLLNVDFQHKIRNVLSELIHQKISKVVLSVLLYFIWKTNDAMLLTLYLFTMGQIYKFV